MIASPLPSIYTAFDTPAWDGVQDECKTPRSDGSLTERRGRKRAPPVDTNVSDPEERKRLIRLAKNRKAAEQCRERRRQEYAEMCDKLKASQQACYELRRRLDITMAELATLKQTHKVAMQTLQQQQLVLGLCGTVVPTSPSSAPSPPTTLMPEPEMQQAMPEQPSSSVSTLSTVLAALLASSTSA